jgi:hypothetical protein
MSGGGPLPLGAISSDTKPSPRSYACVGCGSPFQDRSAWLFGGLCSACRKGREFRELRERMDAVVASVPSMHRAARFGAEQIAKWVPDSRARMSAERELRSTTVTLHGPSGSGKSTLAVAMLRSVVDAALAGDRPALDRAYSARFIPAWAIGEARSQHVLGAGEAPLIELAMTCSTLILDDIGKEDRRKRDAVVEVVHIRRMKELPIIITTEFDAESIARFYAGDEVDGSSMMRRLFAPPAIHVPVGLV